MVQPLARLQEGIQKAAAWIEEQYDKIKDRLEKYIEAFNRFFRTPLSFVSSIIDAITANVAINLPAILDAISVVPFITGPLSILSNLYNAIKSGIDKTTILPTKIVKIIAALTSIALTITMLAITAIVIPLVVAASALFVASTLWDVGVSVCSRLFGEWKKDVQKLHELKANTDSDEFEIKRSENKVLAHKLELYENIHTLVLSVISLTAAALLLTPLAPVGAIILAIVAGYTVLDRLGINPLRKLANKIFGHPFKELELIPAEKIQINTNEMYLGQQAELFKGLGVFEAKAIEIESIGQEEIKLVDVPGKESNVVAIQEEVKSASPAIRV